VEFEPFRSHVVLEREHKRVKADCDFAYIGTEGGGAFGLMDDYSDRRNSIPLSTLIGNTSFYPDL